MDEIREEMGRTKGSEKEVLQEFVDFFEPEIDGWNMRLKELEDEE